MIQSTVKIYSFINLSQVDVWLGIVCHNEAVSPFCQSISYLLPRLFLEKTRGIPIAWLCRRRGRAKTLTCNISIITEDIYSKLKIRVHYPSSNPYYQGREFKMHFLFGIMPLFRLRLFILYQIPHSLALARACGALVYFL